jgi:RNA polymerase sigma factor (sigma-70 family)
VGNVRVEAGQQDLVKLYLDGIGRYPLLSADDEIRLARLVEEGREATARLAGAGASDPPTNLALDPTEVARLRAVERAGARAFEEFVNANLRLVVSIAKRYQGSELPMLDLIQEGNIGLMHAVEKYDWRLGYKFSTYATWWIRQAIGRGIDNTARAVRLPSHTGDQARRVARARSDLEGLLGRTPTTAEVATEESLPEQEVAALFRLMQEPVSLASPVGSDGDSELGDILADRISLSPFDSVAGSMLGGEVEKLLGRLPEKERRILSLRFGLDRGEPRTLDEVGAEMHLTRERIRQIERSALAKLREPGSGELVRDLLAS